MQGAHRVTFEIVREDQSRTTERLRRGDVMAAVTSDPRPVPGCRVVRLGSMRYRAVATPAWVADHLPDGATATALGRVPLIAFDRNDTQQHDFLRKVTRRHLTPPVTWIPSVGEFDNAVRRGMGWGMIPEVQVRTDLDRGRLVEIVPGRHTDVPALLAALAPGVAADGGPDGRDHRRRAGLAELSRSRVRGPWRGTPGCARAAGRRAPRAGRPPPR